jgi:hypothetical protein
MRKKSANGRVISTAKELFEDRVLPSNIGCWSWAGSHNRKGYGCCRVGGRGAKSILAHRLSWRLNMGEIPEGLFVLHKCDNPGCVRPDHLFLGTNIDNIKDRIMKGRRGSQAHKGKPSPRRRISEAQVIEIKEMFERGETPADLGIYFNISREHAWRIATGRVRSLK